MPLTTDDRVEIHELISRYNFAIDFGDVATWVATFTEDGVFHGSMGRYEGRQALTAFADGFVREYPDGRHWVNNLVVDGDGEMASAACYIHMFRASGDRETVATGRYDDRLRKVNGRWRFVERVVTVD